MRIGDPTFLKRFALASRPGAYLRIVEEGELGAGDAIDVDLASLPDHGVTMRLIFDAVLLDDSPDPAGARGALPAAVAARVADEPARWLARGAGDAAAAERSLM